MRLFRELRSVASPSVVSRAKHLGIYAFLGDSRSFDVAKATYNSN